MATQITADLPTLDFPREVDYPTQEDWAAFSAAAELNFGILGGDWSTQMQLWKTEANAMSIELNNSADIAQSTVNYKGDWISQGYALNESVSVDGIYYICKLTHATGQNPTDVSSLYWNLALGNWSLKADKTEVALKVNNYGNETIAGVKTFTSSPIVPTPTTNFQAATKQYVDDNVLLSPNDIRVKTALNASGAAPIYACRAWVNFNGIGTVTIRASGNVSSVIDSAVGIYSVNLVTPMPDSNYCATLNSGSDNIGGCYNYTTTNLAVVIKNGSNMPVDRDNTNITLVR